MFTNELNQLQSINGVIVHNWLAKYDKSSLAKTFAEWTRPRWFTMWCVAQIWTQRYEYQHLWQARVGKLDQLVSRASWCWQWDVDCVNEIVGYSLHQIEKYNFADREHSERRGVSDLALPRAAALIRGFCYLWHARVRQKVLKSKTLCTEAKNERCLNHQKTRESD